MKPIDPTDVEALAEINWNASTAYDVFSASWQTLLERERELPWFITKYEPTDHARAGASAVARAVCPEHHAVYDTREMVAVPIDEIEAVARAMYMAEHQHIDPDASETWGRYDIEYSTIKRTWLDRSTAAIAALDAHRAPRVREAVKDLIGDTYQLGLCIGRKSSGGAINAMRAYRTESERALLALVGAGEDEG